MCRGVRIPSRTATVGRDATATAGELRHELFAGFIHANHGKSGVVGPVVDFEDIFHPPDEFPIVLLRKAPLLFQPRLNRIFFQRPAFGLGGVGIACFEFGKQEGAFRSGASPSPILRRAIAWCCESGNLAWR